MYIVSAEGERKEREREREILSIIIQIMDYISVLVDALFALSRHNFPFWIIFWKAIFISLPNGRNLIEAQSIYTIATSNLQQQWLGFSVAPFCDGTLESFSSFFLFCWTIMYEILASNVKNRKINETHEQCNQRKINGEKQKYVSVL